MVGGLLLALLLVGGGWGLEESTESVCRRLSVGVRTLHGHRSFCRGGSATSCWHSASAMPVLGMLEAANVFPGLQPAAKAWTDPLLDGFLAPGGPADNGLRNRSWEGPGCDYNGVPPAVFVAARRDNPADSRVVAAFARQVMDWPHRLASGAVARGGPAGAGGWRPAGWAGEPEITWPDDSFMCTGLLSHAAAAGGFGLNGSALLEEAAGRVLAVVGSGQRDPVDGLIAHGYEARTGERSCCKWGDGEGWALMAMADALDAYEAAGLASARRADLERQFVSLIESVIVAQNRSSGLWHQLLNDTGSFESSSATGWIVHAIATGIRLGLLPKSYLEPMYKGWTGVVGRIQPDGFVAGLSPGFGILSDRAAYLQPGGSFMWGYGAVVRACAAVGRLEASTPPDRTAVIPPACSDRGSCRDEVAAAVADCNARPAARCELRFDAGRFEWNTTAGAVTLQGLAAGVTISAVGAEVVTYGDVPSGLFQFSNVSGGVSIIGISVDTARLPYTFGKVTAINGSTVSITYNSSQYPFSGRAEPWLARVTNIYGSIDTALRVPEQPWTWSGGGPITHLQDGLLQLERSLDKSFVGKWLVLEHDRSATPALDFHATSDVLIRDTSLWSHAGFGIAMTQVHNSELRNVTIAARDGRPMSIMADGAHYRKCTGYMRLLDSTFERNGDDGYAAHNEYSSVVERIDDTCLHVNGKGVDLAVVGEDWVFRDRLSLQQLAVRRLGSVDFAGARLCFNESLPTSVKTHDLLSSLAVPSDVTIQNCRYWGNLGHGIRIKTPNVVVRNCEIGYNSFGAILMIPDGSYPWMSSLVVKNVTIEDTIFTNADPWATNQYDTDAAAVVVTAYAPKEITAEGVSHVRQPVKNGMVNDGIRLLSVPSPARTCWEPNESSFSDWCA